MNIIYEHNYESVSDRNRVEPVKQLKSRNSLDYNYLFERPARQPPQPRSGSVISFEDEPTHHRQQKLPSPSLEAEVTYHAEPPQRQSRKSSSYNTNGNAADVAGLDDKTDVLFESLRRMSKTLMPAYYSNNSKNSNKLPLDPTRSKDLTSLLSNVHYTDGGGRWSEEYKNDNEEKIAIKKKVPCVACLKRKLDLCETVTIDIDAESTYLHRMCKLMIVLQGAAVERGVSKLVRDMSVQVDCDLDDELLDEECELHDSGVYETISEELEDIEEPNNSGQSIRSAKLKNTKRQSLFNKHGSTISGRRDSYYRRQSYLTTNEYASAPYYQYQIKSQQTVDTACSTQDGNKIDDDGPYDPHLNTDDYKANMIKLANLPFFKSSSQNQNTKQPNGDVEKKAATSETDDGDARVKRGLYNLEENNRRKSIFEEIYNRFEAEVTVKPSKETINVPKPVPNTDSQQPNITQNIILNNGNHIISNDNITTIKVYNPRSVTHIYFVRIDEEECGGGAREDGEKDEKL